MRAFANPLPPPKVHGGIVCTSRWARLEDRERLLGAALANVTLYGYAPDRAIY